MQKNNQRSQMELPKLGYSLREIELIRLVSITALVLFNSHSILTISHSSFLHVAYTREAALVRSILNASMMYLVAKICSENSHVSCGCLFGNIQSQFKELRSKPLRTTEIFLDDQAVTRGEIQSNRPSRSSPGLSISDLTKLNSGSPIRLTKSVDQHLGKILITHLCLMTSNL